MSTPFSKIFSGSPQGGLNLIPPSVSRLRTVEKPPPQFRLAVRRAQFWTFNPYGTVGQWDSEPVHRMHRIHRMPIVEVKDAVKGPARSFHTVHTIHTMHRIKLPLRFKGHLPRAYGNLTNPKLDSLIFLASPARARMGTRGSFDEQRNLHSIISRVRA